MSNLPYHAHRPAQQSDRLRLAGRATMPSSHPRRPASRRSLAWLGGPFAVFLSGALLLVLALSSYRELPSRLSLRQECRMSRMWPSYELHKPPSPSGQGKKYSLYLYREKPQGRPATSAPKRKPALFLPGNAGSYQQVRSVASWSWHEYILDVGHRGKDVAVETDWWTIDFNEDFSAFHAPTLNGQSIYVNEVLEYLHGFYYGSLHNDVPILAHSMGGIVARLALLQSNHPDPSPVKTILTLSTPHYIPPAPIEKGIEQLYQLINESPAAIRRQKYVLLVSLSGGILDTQLPSEYSILPVTWGDQTLQRFTSNLPALWSNVDHLAMMWCDQVRTRVARSIAIEGTPGLTDTLAERKKRWAMALDLADISPNRLSAWTEGKPTLFIPRNSTTNFLVPPSGHHTFALLAVLPFLEDARVLVCDSTPFEEQACKTLPLWAFEVIPASNYGKAWSEFPEASQHYEGLGLRLLKLDGDELSREKFSSVSIQHQQHGLADTAAGWWQAGWVETETHLVGSKTSGGLHFDIDRVALASSTPLRRFRLPQIDSSLFFYELTLTSNCPQDRMTKLFALMLHVYHPATGDGRWYPSLEAHPRITIPVSLHGTSPYMPLQPTGKRGVILEVFAPSQGECQAFTSIIVKIKWRQSVGLWLSRYRIGLASWMMASFALSARMMLRGLLQAGSMPQLIPTILQTMPIARHGGLLLGFLVVFLAILQRFLVAMNLAAKWPAMIRDLLFGLTGEAAATFGFLSSDLGLSLMLGIGLAAVTWTIIALVLLALHSITSSLARICLVGRLGRAVDFDHDLRPGPVTSVARRYTRPSVHLSAVVSIVLILGSIKVYVPYQFVFLAAVLVQLLNVARAQSSLRHQNLVSTSHTQRLQLRLSQNSMVLLHLFLLLPLRGPSLIIFVRNFLAGYVSASTNFATPDRHFEYGFAEDHSIIRILPVLALVQLTTTGRLIETPQGVGRLATYAVEWAYLLLAGYTVAWGIRYPYLQYDISLLIFSLLLSGHYLARWHIGSSAEASSLRQAERSSDRARESEDGERHESVPLTVREGAYQPSVSQSSYTEEQTEKEAAILPFSIPGQLTNEAEDTAGILPSSSPPAAPSQLQRPETPRAALTEPHPDTRLATSESPGSIAPSPFASEIDSLLVSYLSQLDEYLLLREELSVTLSKGFFNLSSAQMAAGGWGTTAGARRGLWDARLRREVEVGVEAEAERLILREVRRKEDDDQGLEIHDEKEERRPDDGLRRRKPSSAVPLSTRDREKAQLTSSQRDESEAADHEAKQEGQNGSSQSNQRNSAPLPPSALYQFSALPSAKLRRTRQDFRNALYLIVEGRTETAVEQRAIVSKEEEEDGGEGLKRNGLVQMAIRLRETEELIRSARKRRDDRAGEM